MVPIASMIASVETPSRRIDVRMVASLPFAEPDSSHDQSSGLLPEGRAAHAPAGQAGWHGPAGQPTLRAMLERLTASDWLAWLGVAFRVSGLAAPLTLRLETITPAGTLPVGGGRQPFSLVFRGPAKPLLPQAIYRLESDAVEPLEIFLVPIGRDADGVTYEAIFN